MKQGNIIDKLSEYNELELSFMKLYNEGKLSSIDPNISHFDDNYWFDHYGRESVVIVKHDRYNPEFVHSHLYFEGIFVLRGKCSQTINRNTFEMNEGDFLIISPYISHSIGVFDDSIVINILIKKRTFKKLFYDFINTKNSLSEFFVKNLFGNSPEEYILFKTKNKEAIKNYIINMLLEIEFNDEHTDYMLNELLKMFFIHLIRIPKEDVILPSLKSQKAALITELIQYIFENYNTITLTDASEKFNFSIPYTSKLIKNSVGITFKEFITDIKLEKAKEYLHNSNLRIKDIAEIIGFPNAEHFMKIFKKKVGKTPSEYRDCAN